MALIGPPSSAVSSQERLVADGRLLPASRPLRLPRRVPAPPGPPDTAAALDDLTTDR